MSPYRSLLRKILPARFLARVNHISHADDRALDLESRLQNVTRILLQQRYPELTEAASDSAPIRGHEFSIYSQEGVDGLLLHIFSKIGVARRRFVEIGCGDGRECNTANLSLNLGWSGTLIDADQLKIASARQFYGRMLRHKSAEVNILESRLTRENVNQVVAGPGVAGEIDLLSIDIDGNDYWIWKELSVVEPRVVVIEYNASFGPEEALVVPYDPEFDCFQAHPSGFYHGASLAAVTKLGAAKGYALIAVESQGVNALFVRQDLAKGVFPALDPQKAYVPHFQRGKLMGQAEQYDLIKDLELVNI
jgi:hypothetical protein